MMTNGCKYLSLAVILIVWAGYGCSGDSGTSVKPCKQTGSCPDTTAGPAPVLNDIQPESGAIGATVTLTGKNFSSTSAENNVTFGNLDANIVSASETTLEVIVPQSATTGSVQVAVNGKSSGEVHFIVTSGTQYDYHSDYPYQLNVIYFSPTNVDPLDNYKKRLSGFMLYIQNYYEQWMNHWGFDKTFGLLHDQGRVKIIRVNGALSSDDYPNNNSGANKIISEVHTYFDQHRDMEPSSKHYLVFTPKPEGRNLDFPYFGYGRWGFVSDVGQKKSTADHDGGGAVHELGHALNLPHNAHRKSLRASLGAAIMHNGNNVWNNQGGASATSFTEASADILNECQVFSQTQGNFYGDVNAQLMSASGTYKNGKIVIDGQYQSDVPIHKAIVLLNPDGGQNYDQIGFSLSVSGKKDNFHVSIDPQKDLVKYNDGSSKDYTAKVWLIPRHRGRINIKLTDFTFTDGVPDIDFSFGAVSTLPKDDWSIEDYSDQEPTDNGSTGNSQVASNIIDGSYDTFWHSRYSDGEKPLPHYLTVDMGEKHEIKGFQFVQRKGISAGAKRTHTKELEIQVKNNKEDDWTSLGNFTLENTGKPQQLELDDMQNVRYFKLIINSSFDANPRASLAEVGAF